MGNTRKITKIFSRFGMGFITDERRYIAYYYTNAMLYKDSLYERIAFKMGYVKASADREYVDWGKIYIIHWEEQATPLSSCTTMVSPTMHGKNSSLIQLYFILKAIVSDKSEFCYAKQLLLFMYRFRRREGIPLLINDVKLNYSTDGQKWLTKFLQWTLSPKMKYWLSSYNFPFI